LLQTARLLNLSGRCGRHRGSHKKDVKRWRPRDYYSSAAANEFIRYSRFRHHFATSRR